MHQKEWFEEWFDSKYYHLLYNNRDESEAELFINNLMNHLQLDKNDILLDMGCGKGRHSKQMNKLGYEVVGLDISEESIAYAQEYESEWLTFYVHDMRNLFRTNYFNGIFSLFTSFGYFKTMREHVNVLRNNYLGLKKGGLFIIDFMNSYKVIENLVFNETIKRKDVDFVIERKLVNNYIRKSIEFSVDNHNYQFTESVYGFNREELLKMLEQVGFDIIEVFGDYSLVPYDQVKSNRMIIVARKPLI